MSRPYFFVNPLDYMNMAFETLEETISSAKKYIGREDGFGEEVESIAIYECKLVSVVSNSTEATKNPTPEAKK